MSVRYNSIAAPGIGMVGEYQVSGNALVVPTSNGLSTVNLEYISKAIVVSAAAGVVLTIFDDADPAGTGVFTFHTAATMRFDIKCKKFTLNGGAANDYSAIVEVTGIPATADNSIRAMTTLGTVS